MLAILSETPRSSQAPHRPRIRAGRGHALSLSRRRTGRGHAFYTLLSPSPAMSNAEAPSWPSLYDISVELFPIVHQEPIQPKGKYLTDANGAFSATT